MLQSNFPVQRFRVNESSDCSLTTKDNEKLSFLIPDHLKGKEESVKILSVPRSFVSGARGGRSPHPIKARLAFGFSGTSGIATNLTYSIQCQPSTSSEYTIWAGLYDEVRVTGGVIHHAQNDAVSSTVATPSQGIMVYDVCEPSTLPNATAGHVYEQKAYWFTPQFVASFASYTASETKTGCRSLRFKVPPGSRRNLAAGNVVCGLNDWVATSDNTETWGYLKGYVEVGATRNLAYRVVVVLDCEFRSRQ
jgi:hypothetical protein